MNQRHVLFALDLLGFDEAPEVERGFFFTW
jgi:hypothetical protein